jgi:hypothetical protein
LEDLSKDDDDEAVWKVLGERFPDKMQHDHMAECLREVLYLAPKDGERVDLQGDRDLCKMQAQSQGAVFLWKLRDGSAFTNLDFRRINEPL